MTAHRLTDRAVIRVAPHDDSDEDAAAFLQGLLTNDVTGTLPVYAGLLTPQGKAMFDMFVWPAANGALLLDCQSAHADELARRLALYRLRRKIDIARDDTVGVYWQAQPGDGGARDPRLGELGQRWVAVAEPSDTPADAEYRAHRLRLGVPEGRDELGDILWLETNAVELNGVSFSKGCYIGQENTARMNWRSKINRRLVVVPLDRSDPKRRKIEHEDLGLAIDHLRVEAIPDDLVPGWMRLEATGDSSA